MRRRTEVTVRTRLRHLAVSVPLVAILAGCSVGGSDDPDPTATSATDAATATSAVISSPTPGASPTIAASPTATEAASPTPEPSPTPSPTSTPRATATPTATSTPTPEPAVPLESVNRFSPLLLTNYTLTAQFTMVSVPGLDNQRTTFDILQSAVDNYQVLASTDTGVFETWVVGGVTYIRQANGEVIELPSGVDAALFSPELLVQTMPAPTDGMGALSRGSGTAGDRAVRLYIVPADAYLAALGIDPGVDAEQLDGVIHLWLDAEWGIPIRQAGSITWTTADGNAAEVTIAWDLSSIGTTAATTSPIAASN